VEGDKKEDGEDGDDGKGVRVTIRLVALDAAGRELDSPNEQTVYLVVGRLGTARAPTPAATSAVASTSDVPANEDAAKEKDGDSKEAEVDTDTDTRPWLVRVVKREATIGPHTFHLHEIYGLSSAAGKFYIFILIIISFVGFSVPSFRSTCPHFWRNGSSRSLLFLSLFRYPLVSKT
jgi:hypothetical protein